MGYARLKPTASVLSCYAICLTLFHALFLWELPKDLSFWIGRFFPFWFALYMLALVCLHLPFVMLFQRLLGLKNRNWLALASAVWGSILALALWCLYNYMLGGFDSNCDPDGFFWGCGISTVSMVPSSLAAGVTGYFAGRVIMGQKAQQPAA